VIRKQELSGKSEARGRNGWFQIRLLQRITWDSHTPPNYTAEILEFKSQREGSSAPIILHLTQEDADALREILHD
jgi:hypothetical protein